MSSVEDIRRLVEYDHALFDRFLRRLQRLPWTMVTADHGTGHRSLRNTMVHILHVWDAWCGYVIPGRVPQMRGLEEAYDSELSWEEVSALSETVWTKVGALVESLTDEALKRKVQAPWLPGEYSVEDAFFQTSFEQAHHLGEVIAVLWQDERKPPEMTWIDVRRSLEADSE